MRWVGRVARIAAMRNAYGVVVGKLEREIPLGTLTRIMIIIIKWIFECSVTIKFWEILE
jgi:hypothetical protein